MTRQALGLDSALEVIGGDDIDAGSVELGPAVGEGKSGGRHGQNPGIHDSNYMPGTVLSALHDLSH